MQTLLKITCVFNTSAPSCLESSSLYATWSSKAEVGKELGAEGVFSNAKTQCKHKINANITENSLKMELNTQGK